MKETLYKLLYEEKSRLFRLNPNGDFEGCWNALIEPYAEIADSRGIEALPTLTTKIWVDGADTVHRTESMSFQCKLPNGVKSLESYSNPDEARVWGLYNLLIEEEV